MEKLDSILIQNLDLIHTTQLGVERIKRNLNLNDNEDVIDFCIQKIKQSNEIVKKGKNWYVYVNDIILTINSYSYTIITAHKNKIKCQIKSKIDIN